MIFSFCFILGTQQQVDKSLTLIGKKFKDLDLTNLYAPPPPLTLPSLPMTSWVRADASSLLGCETELICEVQVMLSPSLCVCDVILTIVKLQNALRVSGW